MLKSKLGIAAALMGTFLAGRLDALDRGKRPRGKPRAKKVNGSWQAPHQGMQECARRRRGHRPDPVPCRKWTPIWGDFSSDDLAAKSHKEAVRNLRLKTTRFFGKFIFVLR